MSEGAVGTLKGKLKLILVSLKNEGVFSPILDEKATHFLYFRNV